MANQNRRDFMRHGLLSLAILPLGAKLAVRPALAQTFPRLNPEAPQARALNYVENAEQARRHSAYEKGERCANCLFFQEANQNCQLFPQHSVEPEGWCQSWTQRG